MNDAAYRAAEQRLSDLYGVQIREHVVDVETPDTSVRVLELGAGDPIAFIHGSPNNAATWIPLAAQLPDRRCLLIERPGAGLTPPLARWSNHRSESAATITAVVDHFGLDETDLVGSSLGGLYAYNFAIQHPDRVRRLIQMGAPAGPSILPMPPIFRFLSLPIPSVILNKALRPDTDGARKMLAQIGHDTSIEAGTIPNVVFEWYSALLCHTDTLEHLVREIRAIATPLGYRSRTKLRDEALAGLAVPTLYLWGNDDSFAKPDQADTLSALTPGATIEHFDSSGHILWYDDPRLIAERVGAFLAATVPQP